MEHLLNTKRTCKAIRTEVFLGAAAIIERTPVFLEKFVCWRDEQFSKAQTTNLVTWHLETKRNRRLTAFKSQPSYITRSFQIVHQIPPLFSSIDAHICSVRLGKNKYSIACSVLNQNQPNWYENSYETSYLFTPHGHATCTKQRCSKREITLKVRRPIHIPKATIHMSALRNASPRLDIPKSQEYIFYGSTQEGYLIYSPHNLFRSSINHSLRTR